MTAIEHTATLEVHPHHRHGWWWKTLLAGLALWIVTILVTATTGNVNLVPTLILVGSFLVPFCVVLFVVERVTGTVSTLQVVLLFFVGGVCGVLGASLLEANLRSNLGLFVAVGFIEEFVKGLVLFVGSRRARPRSPLQGALLGASVGAGFAAFESAGYAFNAAITAQGIDLVSLLQTEAIRAILTPIGHVTWTAILGAVLFGAAGSGRRLRAALLVLVAFVGVALLHALWDSLGGIAQVAALVLSGNAVTVLEYGFLPPRAVDAVSTLTTVLYIVGIVVVGALGALALWLVLRRRPQAALSRAEDPASTGGESALVGHEPS